ncbi:MAG TPA: carboxypeptidase regulatory-like domain-containing protein [Terriglobales bacterium]|nr:carboxypeptidase regulatory-like domain-containing protein [Terriglobales bacterium]
MTIVAVLICASATAQVTSGTIFGTVKDASGAIIKGATVTITAPATGVTRVVTSSDAGDFAAPGLYPGTYTIRVEAPGFKKLEASGFVLSAADKLSAGDLVLAVGTTSDTVDVTADAGQVQLQAESGERSDLITSKQLNDVAMNGRNVLDYVKLIPGVSSTYGLADFHGSTNIGQLGNFSINGTRTNEHEYTIDGASNVDTGNNGGTHVTINTDAIEELKILTSNYQAEFGKAAGGQLAVTTKSGTNQWHGNVRFFHRHEDLNANEFFLKQNQLANDQPNTRPLFRYNNIGYQGGGPIIKDKLFVFWSQEFYRQFIPPAGTQQFYTPTDAERGGDFSQSTDGNGVPVTISGPGITNNKIDKTQLPSALQPIYDQMSLILGLYPEPNVPGFGVNSQNYNFSQNLSANAPRREDILRVDYQLNSKNRLYGRWVRNTETDTSPFLPFPGPTGSGFACSSPINFPGGCVIHQPSWNFSANLVSTISPTILNEFSIGPSHAYASAEGVNGNVSRGANGVTLQLLYPLTDDQAIPDISFGGLNNVNFQNPYLGATPWHQSNTTINVNDNISWVHRNHTFKAGIFYQRSRKDQISWGNINGQVSFGVGNYTFGSDTYQIGDPIAATLLGFFNSFDQSTARPTGYFRYNQFEFYVQDTWKVTPRLTLDYGLRFAWIPPQYDAKNQVALFDPKAYDPSTAVQIDPSSGQIIPDSGDPLDGMKYANQGQIPKGGWDSRGIMPEPRFGFAYDIFSNHKTIFRGGFGMSHDRAQGNLIFNTVFNNPAVVQTPQLAANNLANLPSLQGTNNAVQGDKNIIGADRDGHVPTIYSFSFGIQHEISKGTTMDLAYVGSLGRHLILTRDINAIPEGFAFTAAAQDPNNFVGGVVPASEPGLPPIYAAAGYNFSGAYALGHMSYTNAALVPYKGYGQISYLSWGGTSNYNSLQASLQRRFTNGLTFGVVYTFSKSLTTSASDGDFLDPFNALVDYRAADWDRTHVFAVNYVYDIPGISKHFGGPKWLSYITDNYQLTGVTNVMSGAPVTNLNNSYSFNSGALNGSNMWGPYPYYYSVDPAGNLVTPTVGPETRASRDAIRGGGMQNWDMSLFKNIPIHERVSMQLRLEAYNVFNHPNFLDKNLPVNINGPWQWTYGTPAGGGSGSPDITISKGSDWGTPSDTYNRSGGPGGFRVLQLGAKIIF